MKRNILFVFLITIVQFSFTVEINSQCINNGTLVLEENSTLAIEGDLINNSSLQVRPQAEIHFVGTNNSLLEVNGSQISNLLIHKQNNGHVDLSDELTITESIHFNPGNFLQIGTHNLVLTEDAQVINYSETAFIKAFESGMVHRQISQDKLLVFPIGDSINYTPLSISASGTSYNNGLIKANTISEAHPELKNNTTDYINRYWNIEQQGIIDFSALTTGEYSVEDVSNGSDQSKIYGAHYTGNWSYLESTKNNYQIESRISDSGQFTGSNRFGQAQLKVFLEGAYENGSMNTSINDIIPQESPYPESQDTATVIASDVVDWVLIELRDETNPSTILGSQAALLKSDGSVVSPDGSSLVSIKDAPESAYLVIKHRNHLAIETATTVNLLDPELQDLTQSGQIYNNSSNNNPPTIEIDNNQVMYSGDINQDGEIRYNGNGNDRTLILIRVGFQNSNNTVSGYYPEDISMDGITTYNGNGNDRTVILINVGFQNSNGVILKHSRE